MVTSFPTPATDERRGQETLETIDPGLTSAIVAIDARQRIVAFNSVAESLLGLAAGDVLAGPLDALPGSLRDVLRQTLLHGQPISERQIFVPAGRLPALTLRVT